MPIGSRSYYDSVGSADKKQNGSKPGIFGKGNQPAAKPPVTAQGRMAASTPTTKNTGPAKKRRGGGMQNARPFVPPLPPQAFAPAPATAAPVDGLVAQIVDLAGRVGSVLAQAESAVKRAEQLLASASDAASRSEAAALRSELAASRVQLSTLTSTPQSIAESNVLDATISNQSSQPVVEPSSALQDMLRSGMLQLDKIGERDPDTHANAAFEANAGIDDEAEDDTQDLTASEPPYGVQSDGPRAELTGAKGGMSAGTFQGRERVVGRASRHLERTERGNREAVASGLVTFHHESEIPRVSPFILGLTPEASNQRDDDDTKSSSDVDLFQDPHRKIGFAV